MRNHLAVLALGIVLPLSPLIISQSAADPLEDRRVVQFSNITRMDGSPDMELCEKRYGDGYVVTPSEKDPRRTSISDKGHTVTLIDRIETTGDGIYIEYDRFKITYPGGDDQADVDQIVTGLTKTGSYSGVFSDGTCVGQVMVMFDLPA